MSNKFVKVNPSFVYPRISYLQEEGYETLTWESNTINCFNLKGFYSGLNSYFTNKTNPFKWLGLWVCVWWHKGVHINSKNLPRLAMLSILNAKMGNFLAIFALVCSSYVTISAGTHKRTPWRALGEQGVPMVDTGNGLCSRSFVKA